MPLWLPPLLRLADFGGDWKRYEEAVYAAFCADFLDSPMTYQGLRVGLKRYPLLDGKEATYWHFTSEGQNESSRTPDLRRCERIRWPRQIIQRADTDSAIKVWENERSGQKRTCLWLEEEDYLVILAMRGEFVLPWTAYLVFEEHRKRKLRKEYESLRKQAP